MDGWGGPQPGVVAPLGQPCVAQVCNLPQPTRIGLVPCIPCASVDEGGGLQTCATLNAHDQAGAPSSGSQARCVSVQARSLRLPDTVLTS